MNLIRNQIIFLLLLLSFSVPQRGFSAGGSIFSYYGYLWVYTYITISVDYTNLVDQTLPAYEIPIEKFIAAVDGAYAKVEAVGEIREYGTNKYITERPVTAENNGYSTNPAGGEEVLLGGGPESSFFASRGDTVYMTPKNVSLKDGGWIRFKTIFGDSAGTVSIPSILPGTIALPDSQIPPYLKTGPITLGAGDNVATQIRNEIRLSLKWHPNLGYYLVEKN